MISTKRLAAALAPAAVLTIAAAAHAQRAIPQGAAPRPSAQLAVALKPVVVDPALKPALAAKPKFDPSKVAPKISTSGGRPVIEIARGKKVLLEPTNESPPPASLGMKALPRELEPFRAHVESPWVTGKRVIKLAEAAVTHANDQTAIRDQGGRGTCTAFASMAGLEAWAKRKRGKTLDLSENHAFQRFMEESDKTCTTQGGFTTWKTGPILTSKGVCAEALMPYTSSSCPTSVPDTCKLTAGYKLAGSLHFFTPAYGGTGVFRADNVNLLEAFLKAGIDLVYGVDVAGGDWFDATLDSGVVDVQVDSQGNPAGSVGGHAMLLVGYNRVGNYFVFKNSWGTGNGHDGYVHLSYDYIQTYGKYGYAVTGVSGPGL